MKPIDIARALVKSLPFEQSRYLYTIYEYTYLNRVEPLDTGHGTFFILGSQRSGTTLMALILDAHPELSVHDEVDPIKVFRSNTAGSGFTGFKVPKLTRRYKALNKIFPGAGFIFMRRDIRGTVASMLSLKMKRNGKSWAENHGKLEIEKAIPNIQDSNARTFFFAKLVEFERRRELVSIAALCAYLKTYFLMECRLNNINVTECVYENLVADPSHVIGELTNFLGISWDPAVLHHHEIRTGFTTGRTDMQRPIDTESITKWKTSLALDEVEKIEKFVDSCKMSLGDLYYSPYIENPQRK